MSIHGRWSIMVTIFLAKCKLYQSQYKTICWGFGWFQARLGCVLLFAKGCRDASESHHKSDSILPLPWKHPHISCCSTVELLSLTFIFNCLLSLLLHLLHLEHWLPQRNLFVCFSSSGLGLTFSLLISQRSQIMRRRQQLPWQLCSCRCRGPMVKAETEEEQNSILQQTNKNPTSTSMAGFDG